MTIALANMLQWCFTVLMPSTRTHTKRREDTFSKAERILSDPERVIVSEQASPPRWWTGQVVGDHGTYQAFAVSPHYAEEIGLGTKRVGCFCKAGVRGTLCSHALVAEEMRLRGEDG